jgi:hypothetical protein
MNAKIEAVLTANTAGFTAGLNNASTQVSALEQKINRASGIPLPGEGRSAAASASVFAEQAKSLDKVTAARYAAMEAAKAEESAIRGSIRLRADEAAAIADVSRAGAAGGGASATSAPAPQGVLARFTAARKNAMKSLADAGASDLVKGLGIGALVMGFRAALTNAQQLRDTAYSTGAALDPAVERTAEIADTLDRAKQGALGMVASLLSFVQGGVDRAVAGVSALFGVGTYDENMAGLNEARTAEAQKKRGEAMAREQKKLDDDRIQAARELASAEEAVATARIDAAKEAADTEGKIQIATLEVADAQSALNATKDKTVERAQAELELMGKQAELADLRRTREEEITKTAEDRAKMEAAAADARLRAQERLNAAILAEQQARAKVAAAQAAYATALADQSAASLSEVQSGERGSPEDRRRAAEVERLRQRARDARDRGSSVVIGGEAVSVADQLSTRANQVQSTIGALNSSERDPLASVTAQLEQANEELAQIRESLALIEVSY